MTRVRHRVEVVDEPALAAQQRLVLEPGERPPDPGLRSRSRRPRAIPTAPGRGCGASRLRADPARRRRRGERLGDGCAAGELDEEQRAPQRRRPRRRSSGAVPVGRRRPVDLPVPGGERSRAAERDAREPRPSARRRAASSPSSPRSAVALRPRSRARPGRRRRERRRAGPRRARPSRASRSLERRRRVSRREVARDERRVGLERAAGAPARSAHSRPRSARISPSTTSTVPVGASGSTPTSARTPCALELGDEQAPGRVVAHASRPRCSAPRLAAAHGGVEGRAAGFELDARAVTRALGRRRRPSGRRRRRSGSRGAAPGRLDLLRRRAARCERPERLQHAPAGRACAASPQASAARGRRRRSGRTAGRAREQARGLAAREHAEQLDDGRRAANLVRRAERARVGAARRPDPANGPLRQCASTSCGKRSGCASMRTMLRGSW